MQCCPIRTHGAVAAVVAFTALHAPPSRAQVTTRESVDSFGTQGNGWSTVAMISRDAHFVAFSSDSTALVSGDTNGLLDAFVRDLRSGRTSRVSIDSSEAQADGPSFATSISGDGRYVVFSSEAANLVPGDTNGRSDAFVRDRQLGTTVRVSVDSGGAQGNQNSFAGAISTFGRYVSFISAASNLVPGDTNDRADVFVRDLQTGTTVRVSVDSSGAEGNANSGGVPPSISADGRYVVFQSEAWNLVPGDTNGWEDVFLRDLVAGTTVRVSVDSAGAEGNARSYNETSISADGRYVAFSSDASNLDAGDTNAMRDVFVHDVQSGMTVRTSLGSGFVQANGASSSPFISPDGHMVAFASDASNLVPGDTNGVADVFLHDLRDRTTTRWSVDLGGIQGNAASGKPSLSSDARYVTFWSLATNLVPAETNPNQDVFVRSGVRFTSACFPGIAGVVACPCGNPPGRPGRGCENSSGTGGGLLLATGEGSVSEDSLVFFSTGQRPTTTSLLVQGTAALPAGRIYGQGVLCLGGRLKRLFTKHASGGGIVAPDAFYGEPSITARSAAVGDPILAGESRWYAVLYRDSIVLGGCPSDRQLNVTQAGKVEWSP